MTAWHRSFYGSLPTSASPYRVSVASGTMDVFAEMANFGLMAEGLAPT
jgi:hypothetical protein